MWSKNMRCWMLSGLMVSIGACTYPGVTEERSEIIRDSIWKMDSMTAHQLMKNYRHRIDSARALRDSVIQAYNDSVTEARTSPPPRYRRPRPPRQPVPPSPSPTPIEPPVQQTDTLRIPPITIP